MVKNIKGLPKYIDSGKFLMCGVYHFFIIQEHLGKDLSKAKLNIPETIRVGLKVLESLESLHNLGYIHGDIKPDNILVQRPQKKVTIVDLGMSSKYLDSLGDHVALSLKSCHYNKWFASINCL